MGFRFQRRIRIAPGVRLNLSKSGIGASVGRTGLRLGMDAKRRKYLSLGMPGTGLSYRTFFGRPVTPETIRRVAYGSIMAAAILLTVVVVVAIEKR
jgi:hypothetical protein